MCPSYHMDTSEAQWKCLGQTDPRQGCPQPRRTGRGRETTPAIKRMNGLSGSDPVRLARPGSNELHFTWMRPRGAAGLLDNRMDSGPVRRPDRFGRQLEMWANY